MSPSTRGLAVFTIAILFAVAAAAAAQPRAEARQSADDIEHQGVNLSLGHPVFEDASADPLVRAVEAATRAGIIVVVSAAGNFGITQDTGDISYAGTTSPGNAPSAITAGAYDHQASITRDDDGGTAFNSRGPTCFDGNVKPDLVAPRLRVALSIDFTSADTPKKWSTLTCQDEQAREDEILTGCQTSIAGTTQVWARNFVWGENIVWGDALDNNIVWGNSDDSVRDNSALRLDGSRGQGPTVSTTNDGV